MRPECGPFLLGLARFSGLHYVICRSRTFDLELQ
jgi:hypothetical protein